MKSPSTHLVRRSDESHMELEKMVTLLSVHDVRTELHAKGVEVGEITTQYYGMKQLSVADPDGYELVFQESVR